MRSVSMTPADLVLDRCHVGVLIELHSICAPIETQTFGPQRQRSDDEPTSLLTLARGVGPDVPVGADDSVHVVRPDTVDVNQGALTRAVGVVLQSGDRNDWLDAHPTRREA
jgi:hypothetical protein